ncbi:hypothetical protein NG900_03100 [Ralstonia sp. 21MJYT02-11]|uniref:Uncharacterized protein n=1 Tax=Ralstonia soli TaxID=2953896 RepID=A0ABT1AG41_9RALS|nr:hypothetical protein [Ralstonia soli]MCO5397182.1 hypothetical protein [Ralstonia soli]
MSAVKSRLFLSATLMLALLSPVAHADLTEMKQDIKQGTKDAAKKTGHAARDGTKAVGHATRDGAKAVGHATANGARTVGHGFRDAAHATKCGVKHVFNKPCSNN